MGKTYHVLLEPCPENLKRMGELMSENDELSFNSLKKRLEQWERAGIRLYLDGKLSSAESIVNICVEEDTLYMPDYITDNEGKITEIRYDRISHG